MGRRKQPAEVLAAARAPAAAPDDLTPPPKARKRTGRRAGTSQPVAPTTLEKIDRVLQCQALMGEGVPAAEVKRWAMHVITEADVAAAAARGVKIHVKTWSVGNQAARTYIQLAWRGWHTEDREDSIDRQRAARKRRLMATYRAAFARGEFIAALHADRELAIMEGTRGVAMLPPEMPGETSLQEAIDSIEHAAATLALARQLGAITDEQRATAIDVEPADPTPAPALEVDAAAPPAREVGQTGAN